jgi:hypothetical protein
MPVAILAIDATNSRSSLLPEISLEETAEDVAGARGPEETVRKEFIVERQGKAFCLYAGLLDLAHQQGLKSIQTDLVQTPSEANNRVAICTATVVLVRDGEERQFTGIGDAAPNNVAPAMVTCLIRMAETRAKARALRDAVNIGVAAFEELGEEDAHDGAPERGYAVGSYRGARTERAATPVRLNNSRPANRPLTPESNSGPTGPMSPGGPVSAAGDTATETQIEAIRSLCRRQSVDPEALAKEKCGAESLATLTHAQASDMIRDLNVKPGARTPAVV